MMSDRGDKMEEEENIKPDNKTIDKVAKEQWTSREEVLRAHGEKEKVIDKCRFHYKTGIYHGYNLALYGKIKPVKLVPKPKNKKKKAKKKKVDKSQKKLG